MDKQNNGNPITIKINGEKRPFFEDNSREEVGMPPTENRNDQIDDQPPQEEHDAIVETAATQEAEEESFDWVLPQQAISENELSLYKSVKTPKQRKPIRLPALSKVEKNSTNISAIKSIAISVVFAVLLGTGFGIVMLKLVITDNGKNKAVATKALTAANKETPISKSKEQITFKSFTAYMLQGGVYSKKETADSLAGQAKKDGIPAEIIEMNGQYSIFLGIAGSLEDAKSLGGIFKDKGIDEVFAKTITIPEKKLSNLSSDEKTVIENATMIIPLLADISSNPIIGKSLTNNELKSLSEVKTKLATIDSKKIKNKKVKELNTEISGALKQISDYQKKKDKNTLEGVQQHLLSFLAEYYSI